MKRKTAGRDSLGGGSQPEAKKRALSKETVIERFREGLFEPAELEKYTKSYAESAPYVCQSMDSTPNFLHLADSLYDVVTNMALSAR